MKVAIYARISTENFSQDVNRQLHEVRAYCERMEYEVVDEYVDEGFSAISKMELFNISHRVKSGIANARRKNGGEWGKKSNLTDEVKEQILQKREEGWGFRKLTKEFKVSNQSLRKFLPEYVHTA